MIVLNPGFPVQALYTLTWYGCFTHHLTLLLHKICLTLEPCRDCFFHPTPAEFLTITARTLDVCVRLFYSWCVTRMAHDIKMTFPPGMRHEKVPRRVVVHQSKFVQAPAQLHWNNIAITSTPITRGRRLAELWGQRESSVRVYGISYGTDTWKPERQR